MQLLRTLVFAFLTLSVSASPATGIASARLENGLEVIVIENHAVPLVLIDVAFRSGARVETPETNGLSHLYEHMFFKANKAIPSQEKWLARMNELGATSNATTSVDRVHYLLSLPSENLREGTAFMRDAILDPLFDRKELERERVVVLGEFDRNEATPSFHLSREVTSRLWEAHFPRTNPLGSREVVLAATRQQMLALKERFYVPNNAALLFAGDVTPDDALALAREFFAAWRPAAVPDATAVPRPLKQSSTLAVLQPVTSVSVQRAWQGPALRTDPASAHAAEVFMGIIDLAGSRWRRNLMESGLFDGAFLAYSPRTRSSLLALRATTNAARFDRALAALDEEVSHLADDDYFSDAELESAKRRWELRSVYDRESADAFADRVSFWWAAADLKFYESYEANVNRVTRSEIQRYLRRYVIGKPSVTGVMTSENDLPKLTSLREAEVVRPAKGTSATAMTSASEIRTELFDVDGVRVLLRMNPRSEVVAAKAFLDGGVAYAGAERAGLELLLLQIAAIQSERYPKEQMGRELTRLGAILSSEATPDYSVFSLRAVQKHFGASFDLFLDALFHPRIDAAELDLARQRRLTAIAREEENPDTRLFALANVTAYGAHPFSINPLGTRAGIESVTLAALERFRNETLMRSRVLIVVAGNVSRDDVAARIRAAVAGIPAGDFRRTAPPPIPDADRATHALVERDLPTTYITASYPVAAPGTDDFVPLYVGHFILWQRLVTEIRTKRNLAYAVSASVLQRGANLGGVYVSTADPNATLRVIAAELRRIRTSPPSETELRDVVRAERTRQLQDFSTSAGAADVLGRFEILGAGWKSGESLRDAITAVSPEDVRAAMARYAHPLDFTILGRTDGIDRKLLDSF